MIEKKNHPAPISSSMAVKHESLSRMAATESIVLLKNDSNLLPLSKGVKAAVFGCGAEFTVKGGSGSGDVNTRHNISILDALAASGVEIVNKNYLEDCRQNYHKEREKWRNEILSQRDNGENLIFSYFSNPFRIPGGRRVVEDDLADADIAIYVISRTSGEGSDRKDTAGDFRLSEVEIMNLRSLEEAGIPTVLILNTSGPVQLPEELPQAVLYISQPGQEGGYAVLDILLGSCNPSGRLAATWPLRYSDIPFAETFNAGKDEVYREGIYSGYRYFSSFNIPVAFPFGYGLSYTEFLLDPEKTDIDGADILIHARCTNTGKFQGKETVQIYVVLPEGLDNSESVRLAGYAKTKLLNPGESCEVCVKVNQRELAYYNVAHSAWSIRRGRYGLAVGKDCNSLKLISALDVKEDTVIKRTGCLNFPAVDSLAHKTSFWEGDVPVLEFQPVPEERNIGKEDEVSALVESLWSSHSPEYWIPLLYGWHKSDSGALGNASESIPGAAGETCPFDEVKNIIMADGPAGLRIQPEYDTDPVSGQILPSDMMASLEGGFFSDAEVNENAEHHKQFCTAFPVGTALAQTWNENLVEQVGKAQAEELRHFGISWFLSPGMNIQRNPLCGRNFEYYSEDPLLTGRIASAMVRGIQSVPQIGATVKHFILNNRENDRMASNSIIGERAFREIYLRGFEIAVALSSPECVMTSFNLVNGCHAANCKWLISDILRKELGFKGIVMTDWTTTSEFGGSSPHLCIEAGNDLIMPGLEVDESDIREAYEKGVLKVEDIASCVKRLLRAVIDAGGLN